MAESTYDAPAALAESDLRFGWRDVLIFLTVFGLLWGVMHLAHDMRAPFTPQQPMPISLSPAALVGYACRSLLRMFIAFVVSVLFSLAYGYVAAYNQRAEKVMIPLLDILQSVPVLGFLSVTVTGFMALFPGSLLGLECASIFAIFTSQAWNITFSFYHALKIVPPELREASAVYQLTPWQRFTRLEVPFSMIGLVWNGMMSFGGGWFFLAASESITVLGHRFALPGVGSYMAKAVEQADAMAIVYAILAMVLLVVLVDQLFWRPVVAWSQRFKFEETESGQEPTSVVLDLLRRSAGVEWVNTRLFAPVVRVIDAALSQRRAAPAGKISPLRRAGGALLTLGIVAIVAYGVYRGLTVVRTGLTLAEAVRVVLLGFLTLLRVVVMVILATLIWTPVGVRIGFSPRLARVAQPLVQIGASFPANLTFPLLVILFLRLHIDLNWGSVLLLALGTQWYILFNVIAGASAVPSDLRESAEVFRLRGWKLWRTLILPAIFPAWVTGAITASGGAWNASIVAEVASWGTRTLRADGLGAYIAQATEKGDWPAIVFGIATMSAFVVLLNRSVWKRLYRLAEERYRLD
jgi:NitT/TauT family transport system permease protein